MHFADLKSGVTIDAGPRQVTEAEILEFATRYDPQWFHTDVDRARKSRWKGLIASGWHTCAIAMQLVATTILNDSDTIGSPGVEQIKWPAPLRPGDEVKLRVTVLERRISQSGRVGIVRWQWMLTTQRGDVILDATSTVLFELSNLANLP